MGEIGSFPFDGSLFVTIDDINDYVYFVSLQDESAGTKKEIVSINPVTFDRDTAYYVLQYSEGWEVVSADKRGPIILAFSDTGDYDSIISHESVDLWMKSIAEEIVCRRRDGEYFFSISDETFQKEIAAYSFWRMVTADQLFIEENSVQTRLVTDPIPYEGYWALYQTFFETEVYDMVSHLVETQWHQHAPFNHVLPLRGDSNPDPHYPLGCTAVAGAQMLYFLHYKLGAPVSAPTLFSYCWTGSFFSSIQFFGFSSTIWDNMVLIPDDTRYNDQYYDDPSSVFCLHTAFDIDVDFLNNSRAHPHRLVTLLQNKGISCSRGSYDTSVLFSSLQNGMPVLADASTALIGGAGHTFIIDGYKSTRRKITTKYRWMQYDYQTGQHYQTEQFMSEVSYLSPVIDHIYMNWGETDLSLKILLFLHLGIGI